MIKLYKNLGATLLASLLLYSGTSLGGEEYINKKAIEEKVLRKNIERLARFIYEQEGDAKATAKFTKMLGIEELGNSKYRVWYCIDINVGGKKSSSCGGDIVLTKLDTGRWIIQDATAGTWLLVEK